MIARRKRRSGGFTLIEVLLVLVILVVLASLAVMGYGQVQKTMHKHTAASQIGLLESAVDFYHLDVGDYPQNLEALRAQPAGLPQNKWNGPYLKRDVPLDPWNKQYIYQYPGQHNPDSYDISTTTPEGEVIGNWTTGTKQ